MLPHACRTQVKSAENHLDYRARGSHGTEDRLVHSRTYVVSFSSGRLPRLWFGTLPPWLAQRLHTSRRRGTRLPSGVSPSETAGVLHLTSSRVGCFWLLGKPCYHIRAAHTTPSCSDLLKELCFTHSTKPNFPAARKFFKCLTECASHSLEHVVV
jgi:hypothetical protein